MQNWVLSLLASLLFGKTSSLQLHPLAITMFKIPFNIALFQSSFGLPGTVACSPQCLQEVRISLTGRGHFASLPAKVTAGIELHF